MLHLLRLLHVPFWRRAPGAFLLPSFGVALGVATIVAIDLAGASAVRSFRDTLERLDGRTTHRVAGRRVPDGLARELARLPGIEASAPVVEAVALYAPDGGPPSEEGDPLRLFGVDPLAEGAIRALGVEQTTSPTSDVGAARLFREFLGRPGALLVSAPFLRRHGLSDGDSLPLVVGTRRSRAYVLAALPEEVKGLEVPDNLAVADVASVQELSGRLVGVDRVDLNIAEGAAGERALAAVRRALPPEVRVERPGGRAGRLERGLSAFRANVRALSYLALFVSFFLIYNSLLISVLRRRPLLAVARCLGATRREVLAGWLGEALVTAVAGVALGWILGLVFAAPALRAVARTAGDLYGGPGTAELELAAGPFIKAGVLGLVFTLFSALLPASEAAATPPAHTATRSGVERVARRRRRPARAAALLLGGVAVTALAWPTTAAVPGYVGAAATALAAAVLVPDALDLAMRLALSRRWGFPAGVLRMSAADIRANGSRTGVAVAALAVALGMSVAMGTLVQSFRADLVGWIETSVRADVYVSPLGLLADREGATLPPDLGDRLGALPEVAAVDTYRGGAAVAAGRDVFLGAVDAPVLRRHTQWPVLAGGPAAAFFDRLQAGEAGISETLHRTSGIEVGDSLPVLFQGRSATLRVAGVYRDYSTDRGVVLVDRAALSRRLDLGPPRSIALYLRPGVDTSALVASLQRGPGRELALIVRSNRDLRERALAVFERTFAITRAMEAIGLAVAAIGILSALLAMLLERGRELATLRALGMTRRQLSRMLLGESTLLALVAWLFAVVLGAALAWILIAVVNVRSFGWAIGYRVPWSAWGAALLASLAAAWLATLWPLRRVAGLRVAPLLREE